MRRAPLVLAIALFLIPSATAEECTTQVDELCDAAKDAYLDRLFGDYADFGLIFLGLVALAFVWNLLVAIVRRFRPRRGLKVRVEDELREIEPGASARLVLQVENPNKHLPVQFMIEPGVLPTGWSSKVRVDQPLPDGFIQQAESEGNLDLRVEGRAHGGGPVTVTTELSAPAQATDGDTLEYEVQFIPYRRGVLRPRKAKVAQSKLLVIARLPTVAITKLVHEPPKIVPGGAVKTRAHVVNKGDKAVQNVPVRFFLNGNEVDQKVVPDLPAAGESEVEFAWTAQAGENRIRVAVA